MNPTRGFVAVSMLLALAAGAAWWRWGAGVEPVGPITVHGGEAVQVNTQTLERLRRIPGGQVSVDLMLPSEALGVELRDGRIISHDSRALAIDTVVPNEDGSGGRVRVPASFFSTAGFYVIEIRTDERSPFPVRRFRLEVAE